MIEIKEKILLLDYPHVKDFYFGNCNHALHLVTSPFSNCQTYTIGNIKSLLKLEDREDKLIMLRLIQKSTQKHQVLVDVRLENSPKFLELFPEEDLVFKQEYINSNGSQMCMILMKTKSLVINK